MRFLFVLVLAFALAIGGCGVFGGSVDGSLDTDINGGNNGGNNNGGGNVTEFAVQASAGTTPTYTWDGGGAHSVAVVRADDPSNVVWAVAFLGLTNGIDSGVVHGTVPQGSVQGINAEPVLTQGVTYRVSVARANSNEIGWVEFTP